MKHIVSTFWAIIILTMSLLLPSTAKADSSYKLTVMAKPTMAGTFNTSTAELKENETIHLYAYTNANFKFIRWVDDSGAIISQRMDFVYTMPAKDVTLTAEYEYNPANPANPAKNHWNKELGDVVIDDFTAGTLSNAISTLLNGGNRNDVTMITVAGIINNNDLGVINNYKNCTLLDLSRVTGITQVPSYAFDYTNLESVYLPATIEEIGYRAFYECKQLSSLTVYAMTPPTLGSNVFTGVPEGLVVYVPAAAIAQYQEAEGWKNFTLLPIQEDIRNVSVNLPFNANPNDFMDLWLELTNTKSGQRMHYIMKDQMTYTFHNIIRNTEWNVTLRNERGDVFGQIDNVEVKDEDVTVTFASLSKPQNINLVIMTPDGNDVSEQTEVTWKDASGNYLAQGTSLTGLPISYPLTYQVVLPQELAMAYNTPLSTEYITKEGGNDVICQLQPIPQVQVSGKVKDAKTGLPLGDAVVSMSQTFGGKYSKTQNAKTDQNGTFSLNIANVPTTVGFAATDYVSQTIICDSLMNGTTTLTIPDVSLHPITGATVSIEFIYTSVDGETVNWYTDYQNVDYTLFNVTKNKTVSQYNVQYPQIVLLEEVEDGDELRLTATSRTNAFMPVETTATIDEQKAVAKFDIVELGQIHSSFTSTGNASVVGSLYDANGKFVKDYNYQNASLTISNLADGQYTLVTMRGSRLFNTIYDLAQLPQTGLVEGTDYVQNTVEVKSGTVSQISIEIVPTFDESKLYYTGENTTFTVNKPSIVAGNYLTLTGRIDFKPAYATSVSNVQMIVDLPESCEFVENSVMVGNSTSSYTINGNQITIPMARYTDRVRFCIIPTLGGEYAPSAFVQFDLDGETVTQPIGSVNYTAKDLSITLPSTVAKTSIHISGTAIGQSSVEIYDDGMLIGNTTSLANGTWETTCELNEPYNLSTHSIYAKVTTKAGMELISETKQVVYDINMVTPEKVTMLYYNPEYVGQYNIVFDFINGTVSPKSYYFFPYKSYPNWYGSGTEPKDFTFIADLSNNDSTAVNGVTIRVYTDNGYWRNLEAQYNTSMNRWVAVSQFEEEEAPVGVEVDLISRTNKLADRECFDANLTALENKRTEILQLRDSVQSINIEISALEEDAIKTDSLLNVLEEEINNEISKEDNNYNRLDELLASYLSLTGSIYSASDFNKDYIEVWDKEALYKLIEESDQIIAREDQTDDLLKLGDLLLTTSMQISADESFLEYETDLFREESDTICFEDDGVTKIFYKIDIEKDQLLGLSEDNRIELPMTDSSIVYVYYENNIVVIVDEKGKQSWIIEEKKSSNATREVSRKRKGVVDDLRKTITKVENLINDIVTFANGRAEPLRKDIRIIEEEISKNENWKIFYRQQMVQLERDVVDIERQLHQLDQLPSPTTYSELYNESGIKYQDLQTRRSLLEKQLLQKQQKIKSLNWENIQLKKELGGLKKRRILKLGILSNIMDIVQIGQGLWQVIDIITYEIQDLNKWTSLIQSINENYNCETKEESAALTNRAKALKEKSEKDQDRINKGYISSCAITTVSTAINAALTFNKGIGWIVKMLTSNIFSFINDQAKNIYNNTKAESERLYRIRLDEKGKLKCKNDEKCPRCGKNPCECPDKCPRCGNRPCTCPDKCLRCGKNPCECPPPPNTTDVQHDPSGYVYEGVASNRLQGVIASCYYKETVEDMYGDLHENVVLWDAEEYAQENPLFTDEYGMYRWDVPKGLWQVKFEKEGYETTYSEWLPVPPPQLDINIAMKQNRQPEVKTAHAYEDAVEVEFDKYMIPESLNTDNIIVMQNGTAVEGTIELLNEEVSYEGEEETFASKIRFNAEQPFTEQEVTLLVTNRVKSYANIRMQDDYQQTFTVEQEIKQIVCDSTFIVGYGSSKDLKVTVLPISASQGKTLSVKTSSSMILGVETGQVTIGNDGTAQITLTGELPGTAALTFSVEGIDKTAVTIVNVEQKASKTVATPTSSIVSGTVVEKGTAIALSCETDGAIIYYTLDGSCPCDDTDARHIYDGTPIIVDESITIKATAIAPNMAESEVVEFTYIIDGITDIAIVSDLQISPVPIHDKVNISAGGKVIKSVILSNIKGQVMKSSNTPSKNITLDVSALPTGVHIVKATVDNKTLSQKVIKVD